MYLQTKRSNRWALTCPTKPSVGDWKQQGKEKDIDLHALNNTQTDHLYSAANKMQATSAEDVQGFKWSRKISREE